MFVNAVILSAVSTLIVFGTSLFRNNRINFGSAVFAFVMSVVLTYFWIWIMLPPMTGWLNGYVFVIWFPLLVNVAIGYFTSSNQESPTDHRRERGDSYYRGHDNNELNLPFGVFLGVISFLTAFFVIPFLAFVVAPVAGATSLHDIPKVTVAKEPLEEIDVAHIRLTPLETAEWLGDKVIGQGNLGAQFEIGNFEIQRVQGTLYWVAPLEYRGFFKYMNGGGSPGYVMVNAEQQTQQAQLHTGYHMRYMPSAYFGEDLHRYLYEHGWDNRYILEPTFEVDDNLKPWWVITVGHPTIGTDGEVVDGAVIVDPETGAIQFYPIGQTPDWVDRVAPYSLAIEYANWWGRYAEGFWNTIFGQRNVQQVTDIEGVQDAFLVWGKDNHAKWFAGLTSPSAKDASLTGYMMMNSVTGEITVYPVSGIGNEKAVLQAVDSAVANFKGWHGAQPIFYNIYGQEAWLVPILSESFILQKVAIVHAQTLHVTLGDTKQNALAQYQRWLVEGGSNRAPTETSELRNAEGRVVRISSEVRDGRTVYFFIIDTVVDRIFTADSSLSEKLILTQPGDRVQVQFADTNERIVSVGHFGNLDILPDTPPVPGVPAATPSPSPIPTPTPTPIPTPTATPYAE